MHGEPESPVWTMHQQVDRFAPHPESVHTEHGVTYLIDGWIEMEHGQPLRAESGTFTLVPAGVPHRLRGGANAEFWLVGFCSTCVGLDEQQP